MPDYGFTYKGYKLYFTMKCLVEPMHAHVEENYVQSKAAKIWIGENGRSKIQNPGKVPEKVLKEMQEWIKVNYEIMAEKWNVYGGGGFYAEIDEIEK